MYIIVQLQLGVGMILLQGLGRGDRADRADRADRGNGQGRKAWMVARLVILQQRPGNNGYITVTINSYPFFIYSCWLIVINNGYVTNNNR